MTSWMIGHYGGWRAAISGAAVNNLIDEYNLSDGNASNRYGFANFVSPFASDAALRLYLAQSPISYARNIHTPTLILTDLRDARVPPTQSFEMYHALQTNGTYVEFKAWPIAGHNPTDPVRSLQRLSVWTQWLDRWLK
jgi:dipeptidyl aminopeptidase/acylaminoacyl peptidase